MRRSRSGAYLEEGGERAMQVTMKGLLGPGQLHARVEEIKRAKGTPPWTEKVVVNDQIVGTLICQPPGHPTDRHYHLSDEWWVVLEGEIDWEIEGRRRRSTRGRGIWS